MEVFSLRVPEDWAGRLNSARAQGWLADFFQNPCPLPADPGPGSRQMSLSLPAAAVRALSDSLGDSAAAALRRLAALHIGLLPAAGQKRPMAPQVDAQSVSLPTSDPGGLEGVADNEGFGLPIWSLPDLPIEQVSEAQYVTATSVTRWSGLSFEGKATLIMGVIVVALIILFGRFGKRASVTSEALTKPAFTPWMPLGD